MLAGEFCELPLVPPEARIERCVGVKAFRVREERMEREESAVGVSDQHAAHDARSGRQALFCRVAKFGREELQKFVCTAAEQSRFLVNRAVPSGVRRRRRKVSRPIGADDSDDDSGPERRNARGFKEGGRSRGRSEMLFGVKNVDDGVTILELG